MMTRVRVLFAVIMIVAASTAVSAFDAEDLSLVSIENQTGIDVEYLFLSPADSEYWGPELLGADWVLEAGGSIGYYLMHPNGTDLFDFLAIDAEGTTYELYDYELGDGGRIEISDGIAASEPTEFEFVTVIIENKVLPVEYLFISPSDSEVWGADFLDENTVLASDESISFVFPASADPISYDFMAVDEEGNTYSFSWDIDVESEGLEISIDPEDIDA